MRSVKEIRLLDPATGTMHFGLVAFDLLAKMYEEEMARLVSQDGRPSRLWEGAKKSRPLF